MANADEYNNAIARCKSDGYARLSSADKQLVDKAAAQAGSMGNAARAAKNK